MSISKYQRSLASKKIKISSRIQNVRIDRDQMSQRLIASALFDSAIASGGWCHPPKISETTGPMTMKFLPDVKLSREARKQKIFLT